MNLTALGLDLLLGLALIGLAWQALASPGLFRAIVLFITFGLLMALTWVRLEAPDIALAEAAVGAGLTGVLLLVTLARHPSTTTHPSQSANHRNIRPLHRKPGCFQPLAWSLTCAGAAFFAMVAWALLQLPSADGYLSHTVLAHLDEAGASHPVTAVLLNFRAWDTLLEVAILLLAVVAAWSLGERQVPARETVHPAGAEVLQGLVRLLLPFIILVAGYLVWRGGHAPGGAFQAGTLLAAGGILLLLAGLARPFDGRQCRWRLLLGAGLLLFLIVALATWMAGGVLDYPDGLGHWLIVLIELGLTLSITLTFMALFSGENGRGQSS